MEEQEVDRLTLLTLLVVIILLFSFFFFFLSGKGSFCHLPLVQLTLVACCTGGAE